MIDPGKTLASSAKIRIQVHRRNKKQARVKSKGKGGVPIAMGLTYLVGSEDAWATYNCFYNAGLCREEEV